MSIINIKREFNGHFKSKKLIIYLSSHTKSLGQTIIIPIYNIIQKCKMKINSRSDTRGRAAHPP